jgi:kynurenine 3-monooxygenase
MKQQQKIIIVGAGLCGSLLAIRLAQRGFKVALYEKRPDLRKEDIDAGKSINLALSDRGLMALDQANLKETILKNCIPMRGRLIHPLGGNSFLSPYSGRSTDYINSVSRPGLNMVLLQEAEKYNNIELHFNAKVVDLDLKAAKIKYKNSSGGYAFDDGEIIIGTDGAGSVVRRGMMKHTSRLLFNYSQDFLRSGYKELSILPNAEGGWKIEKEVLHIWPRGEFMIIALPNLDGSFTLTMFHPFETEVGFNHLKTDKQIQSFFETYYPSLLPYIPHYLQEYKENPVGTLGTIKCFPWQAFNKGLIMGDAAHAVVPFYGQGMNCSFEDVRVFDNILEKVGPNWEKVFNQFQEERKANSDAIADLAIDNFYEMRDKVKDPAFIRKRQIEMQLEQQFPDYYSKYSLVTFNPQLPYESAMKLGRKQDQLLLEMCSRKDFEKIPLKEFHQKLKKLQHPPTS